VIPDPKAPLRPEWAGSVAERVASVARQAPDRVALQEEEGAWSYRQLDERSNQLAHFLRSRGVGEGHRVLFFGHRSATFVSTVLGILKAGAAFSILDPAYPPLWQLDVLEAVEPTAWIELEAAGEVPAPLRARLHQRPPPLLLRLPRASGGSGDPLAGSPVDEGGIPFSPDRPATIFFTSGSSGKPKGVLGTHRPIAHFLDWHHRTFSREEPARFGMLAGLAHDPIIRDMFCPLWAGAALCIPPPAAMSDPPRLVRWLQEQQVTTIHVGPALGRSLSDTAAVPGRARILDSLRYVFFHGDAVRWRDVEAMRRLAPRVRCISYYGATETPQAMAFHEAARPAGSPVAAPAEDPGEVLPLGRPIEGVQLLILDENQQQLREGEAGEIWIRTPYLSQGYWADPELTRERFRPHPVTGDPQDRLYRTGDLGRYRPDGEVEFRGRADRQLKVRGFRVMPAQVEQALMAHPQVDDARVLGQPEAGGETQLIAYVRSPHPELGDAALREFLGERLPPKMIPSRFVIVPKFPVTANGKVDLAALGAVPLESRGP
jgi:amino acid adenylation domain-containing protein